MTLLENAHAGLTDAIGVGQELRVSGVKHRYQSSSGGVHALGPIDLAIERGEFVCIVGPSGCGKSTLLELIAGLRTPSEGTIYLQGRRIVGPSEHRGFVSQSSSSLFPWLDVRSNVEVGLRIKGVKRGERRKRVEIELERVGLTEFAQYRPYELSGGMQQRLQIARTLAVDPDLLLLDEPFGALDALTRESLQVELRNIWATTGRTIIFVTHSVEEAVLLSSRTIVISSRPGRVVRDIQLPFAKSRIDPADARHNPEFLQACADIRDAIENQNLPQN